MIEIALGIILAVLLLPVIGWIGMALTEPTPRLGPQPEPKPMSEGAKWLRLIVLVAGIIAIAYLVVTQGGA